MAIEQALKRKLDLLYALATVSKPDLEKLALVTGIPVTSIKRHISGLRSDLGVTLIFKRDAPGHLGTVGFYEVEDWGMFDRARFAEFWKESPHIASQLRDLNFDDVAVLDSAACPAASCSPERYR